MTTTSESPPDWWDAMDDLCRHDNIEDDEAEALMRNKSGARTSLVEGVGVSRHGWKVSLDHVFELSPSYWSLPPLTQIPSVLGLSVRYLKYYMKLRRKKKRPCMDFFNQTKLKPVYGVPLGGIGCGTINRGWKGDFCRWQLKPGVYTYDTPSVDQFIVSVHRGGTVAWQQVLNPRDAPSGGELRTWRWGGGCTDGARYVGLYPRAWTVYHIASLNITLTCRQISPVFPHNYQDTSLPVGVFVWEIENKNDTDEFDVTICMCMENGTGGELKRLTSSGLNNTCYSNDSVEGVEMLNTCQYEDMPFTLNVAAAKKEGIKCSVLNCFDPTKDGSEVWKPLLDYGCFQPCHRHQDGADMKRKACAVSATCRMEPNTGTTDANVHTIDFALCWHMPKIRFGGIHGNKAPTYKRRYTRFHGDHQQASIEMVQHALKSYRQWELEIEKWQRPVLDNPKLPAWYKSAIFNELYYVSDGGSVWVEVEENQSLVDYEGAALVPHHNKHIAEKIRKLKIGEEFGRFAYLEGHEYKMFNTYDVHFYASITLASLWPNLQLSIQSDFAIGILQSEPARRQYLMDGKLAPAKTPNCVPHDLGCPDDEPWLHINTYFVHDTAEWKDLNPKFVLQVFRDYHISKNMEFLKAVYPVCKIIMEETQKHDKDGDGLIENNGSADQTFDGWFVTGPSAYCGGLWLGALRCMLESAKLLAMSQDEVHYKQLLDKAAQAYQDKLWNGKYYNYDCSSNLQHRSSVMADQCVAQSILALCRINDVLPEDQIKSSLDQIFQLNVMSYDEGRHGAVNGMLPSGKVDQSSVQSDEVWSGVTYMLAATMCQYGMTREGMRTASGIYRKGWQQYGMAYQTPEAMRKNQTYRSLAYMRPLSIWAIQHALEHPLPDEK